MLEFGDLFAPMLRLKKKTFLGEPQKIMAKYHRVDFLQVIEASLQKFITRQRLLAIYPEACQVLEEEISRKSI